MYLIGIDLGTTNSAFAYKDPSRRGATIQTFLFSPEYRLSGRESRTPIFPSLVTFCVDGKQWVGGDARQAFLDNGQRGDVLIGQAKNWIGDRSKTYSIPGEKTVTPIEISTLVLKKMLEKFSTRMGYFPKKAVICIPASFDPGYRETTEESAKKAGIEEVILLDEPRAVIYYLLSQLAQQGIPDFFEEFKKESLNCMVYDFGGGTVDVSFHKITKQDSNLRIDDYGISRYTKLGGNTFDKKLLTWMLAKHNIPEDKIPEHTKFSLETVCEEFKINLSEKGRELLQPLNQGWKKLNDQWEQLKSIEKLPDVNFTYGYNIAQKINSQQYMDIVKEIMGWEYTWECTGEQINQTNNIIAPIIDVLQKTKEANEGRFLSPDMVILNGQMCNFFLILKRLREFFPPEVRIISSLKEDWVDYGTSVAVGAVQYASFLEEKESAQYTLLKKETIRTPECYALQIEDRGQKIWYYLCEKGDELPKKIIVDELQLRANSPGLLIPVYSAMDKADMEAGNGKAIIYKKIKLNQIANHDIPLIVSCEINKDRIVTLQIFDRNTKGEIATVSSTHAQDGEISFSTSELLDEEGNKHKEEKIQFLRRWHKREPLKPWEGHCRPEQIDRFCNLFREPEFSRKSIHETNYVGMQEHQAAQIEQEIIKADNGDVLGPIIEAKFREILQKVSNMKPGSKMDGNCHLFKRIVLVAGGLYPALYHAQDQNTIKAINLLFNQSAKLAEKWLDQPVFLNQILSMTIQGWSRMGRHADGAEQFIRNLLKIANLPSNLYYVSLVPLSKVCKKNNNVDSDIFDFLAKGFNSPIVYNPKIKLDTNHSLRWRENISWCVGSLAYRKEDLVASPDCLENLKSKLIMRLQIESNPSTLQKLIFAVSGIFYQPEAGSIFQATQSEQDGFKSILKRLHGRTIDNELYLKKYIDLAMYCIEGKKLTELKDELFALLCKELDNEESSL